MKCTCIGCMDRCRLFRLSDYRIPLRSFMAGIQIHGWRMSLPTESFSSPGCMRRVCCLCVCSCLPSVCAWWTLYCIRYSLDHSLHRLIDPHRTALSMIVVDTHMRKIGWGDVWGLTVIPQRGRGSPKSCFPSPSHAPAWTRTGRRMTPPPT